MHRDIFEIINKGLVFKLTNSPSFGELLFFIGFIQETTKRDQIVKRNDGIPPWKIWEKALEGIRRQTKKVAPKDQNWGSAGLGLGPVGLPLWRLASSLWKLRPLPPRMHLHCSFSRFDPRGHVYPTGLYNQTPAPSLELSQNPNSCSYIRIKRGVPWNDLPPRASHQKAIRSP